MPEQAEIGIEYHFQWGGASLDGKHLPRVLEIDGTNFLALPGTNGNRYAQSVRGLRLLERDGNMMASPLCLHPHRFHQSHGRRTGAGEPLIEEYVQVPAGSSL